MTTREDVIQWLLDNGLDPLEILFRKLPERDPELAQKLRDERTDEEIRKSLKQWTPQMRRRFQYWIEKRYNEARNE